MDDNGSQRPKRSSSVFAKRSIGEVLAFFVEENSNVRARKKKRERERERRSNAAIYPLDLLSRLPSVFLSFPRRCRRRRRCFLAAQKPTRGGNEKRLARPCEPRARICTASAIIRRTQPWNACSRRPRRRTGVPSTTAVGNGRKGRKRSGERGEKEREKKKGEYRSSPSSRFIVLAFASFFPFLRGCSRGFRDVATSYRLFFVLFLFLFRTRRTVFRIEGFILALAIR